jgi:hypothetical protein
VHDRRLHPLPQGLRERHRHGRVQRQHLDRTGHPVHGDGGRLGRERRPVDVRPRVPADRRVRGPAGDVERLPGGGQPAVARRGDGEHPVAVRQVERAAHVVGQSAAAGEERHGDPP